MFSAPRQFPHPAPRAGPPPARYTRNLHCPCPHLNRFPPGHPPPSTAHASRLLNDADVFLARPTRSLAMARERLSLLPAQSGTTARILDHIAHGEASAGEAALAEGEHAHLAVPAMSLAYRYAKRTLDLVVSATVPLVLSPLLALTPLLIILPSKGPALFRQQRVGEGGRIFTMYKFRSMYEDADHTLHQVAYAHFVAGRGGDREKERGAVVGGGGKGGAAGERA